MSSQDSHTTKNLFDSAQLLLSEKRTALSVLRTGASIFVLPLSVLSLLIATSKMYEGTDIWHLMTPLLVICAGLVTLSLYLIFRALRHIKRYEKQLELLKTKNPILFELID